MELRNSGKYAMLIQLLPHAYQSGRIFMSRIGDKYFILSLTS